MKLHPDFAPLLQMPPIDMSDVARARGVVNAMLARLPKPLIPEGLIITDRTIPGPLGAPEVPVRIYRMNGHSPAPVLVYFHAGGFMLGDLETEHASLLHIASQTPCTIISVDYRLAPEQPYPAGVEDCYTALLWTFTAAAELGIDKDRMAVGGASAGGALAAAVALMARDRKGPELVLQVLTYPVLDNEMTTSSVREFSTIPPFFDGTGVTWMWRNYLANSLGGENISPYAAPMRADDLSGLPGAYVVTAEYDPLRDEGIVYAQRLLQAGVPVELHNVPGAPHGFEMMSTAQISQHIMAERIAALRIAFNSKKRNKGSGIRTPGRRCI